MQELGTRSRQVMHGSGLKVQRGILSHPTPATRRSMSGPCHGIFSAPSRAPANGLAMTSIATGAAALLRIFADGGDPFCRKTVLLLWQSVPVLFTDLSVRFSFFWDADWQISSAEAKAAKHNAWIQQMKKDMARA